MARIVAVTFDDRSGYGGSSPPCKYYHYLTDLDLQIGDKCVVDSPYGGETLVTVRSLDPVDGVRHPTKWVICKVDRRRYEARQAAEAELAHLKDQLNGQLRVAEERMRRQALIAAFPEIAETIKQIEGLEATLGTMVGANAMLFTGR